MDNVRDLEKSCCPDHGNADKSALGKNNVGLNLAKELHRLCESLENSEGIREVLGIKVSAKLACCNSKIRDIVVLYKLFLDSVVGTDVENIIASLLESRNKGDIGVTCPALPPPVSTMVLVFSLTIFILLPQKLLIHGLLDGV